MKSVRGCWAPLLAVAACSFHPGGEVDGGGNNIDAEVAIDAADDDGAAQIDAADIDAAAIDASTIDARLIDATVLVDAAVDASTIDEVVHLADDSLGTGDLVVNAAITTTTSNTGFGFGMQLPSGVTFTTAMQEGGGPELAVLRVRNLTISAGIRVVGSRPLVIVADSIALNNVIDAGARHNTPGAGGNATGPGVGAVGAHLGTYGDSGGGGGSFGGDGGPGGNATCMSGCTPDMTVQGAAAGTGYGDAAVARLQGGSGGGASYFPGGQTQCTAGAPGAGGGAVQLSARTSITIGAAGGINVGGGGGSGGDMCNSPFNWLAGLGGGSGGAIYLQSPIVQNTGTLSANGGGGGGGAGQNGNGMNGANATLGTTAAAGGPANGNYSAAGGNGAVAAATGSTGGTAGNDGNGGGGGGGTGRIHVRYRTTYTAGTQSPTAATSMY